MIVFGATGAIGTELVQILCADYPHWTILAVTRDLSKSSRLASLQLANVTLVQGDPFEKASVAGLSRDCDLVFCCIGFHKYQAKYWAAHWPTVVQNLLSAVQEANTTQKTTTRRHGWQQRLVFCDNLYAHGAGHATAISTSTTSTVPASLTRGKPHARSWMRQVFARHMKEHAGTLTVVGGSDFFGPHVTDTSFLGDTITGKIVTNQPALAIGSVQHIHDFCYAPDFARALATVAVQYDTAYDRFWICPHAIHNKSLQQIANDIAQKIHPNDPKLPTQEQQDTNVSFLVLGKYLLYLLSPFMSFAWEMIEMNSFWSMDYRIDDSEFIQTFGVQPTDYDQALQALVDFYQTRQS